VTARTLIAGLPPLEQVRAAVALSEQIVILLPEWAVDYRTALRREFRDNERVMVAAADPPVLPWVDRFFTAVWAGPEWPEAELRRVATLEAPIERLPELGAASKRR